MRPVHIVVGLALLSWYGATADASRGLAGDFMDLVAHAVRDASGYPEQATRVSALERRVADQERRIDELKAQVGDLQRAASWQTVSVPASVR